MPGWSVANVTSTTIATSGRSENAVVRAPPKVISSCATATAKTSPGAPPASATSRAASQRDVAAEPVVHRARDEAVVGQLDRLAGDHRDVADAHQRARLVAVGRADVDVQVLELRDLLAVVVAQQVDRLLADHAGDDAVARGDLDALADEDHRVPAADAGEPQEAVVVDVVDDQADLVDVADDRRRTARRPCPRTRATVEPTVSRVTSANAGGRLAEDGRRGLLVARGPGGGQQLVESVRQRHAARQVTAPSSWRSTNGRMPPCW